MGTTLASSDALLPRTYQERCSCEQFTKPPRVDSVKRGWYCSDCGLLLETEQEFAMGESRPWMQRALLAREVLGPALRIDNEWLKFTADPKNIKIADDGRVFVPAPEPEFPGFWDSMADCLEEIRESWLDFAVFFKRGIYVDQYGVERED